jgi:hypothetical protein
MTNMGSNKDYEAFNGAKEALLSSYNSQQSNQTTRLLGFVGLLFSIMLLSSQNNLSIIVIDNIYRVFFQIVVLFLLLTFIAFTFGRFSVFSQLSSDVIYVSQSEVQTDLKNGVPIHHALINATWVRVRKRKFFKMKLAWFATEGEPSKDRRWGFCLSMIFSAILTAVIAILFLL